LGRSSKGVRCATRYAYIPGAQHGGLIPTHLIPSIREANALVSGTWDIEVVDELAPPAGDIVIDKLRRSSFYGTQLEPVLTSMAVNNLVICGVTTNMCVETIAWDAGQRDYLVHVISDATAQFEKSRHDHALFGISYGCSGAGHQLVRRVGQVPGRAQVVVLRRKVGSC
jgi:ureidoacrylate peracid hydrolase